MQKLISATDVWKAKLRGVGWLVRYVAHEHYGAFFY